MQDPLPAWRDGEAKAAIVDFVRRVCEAGGADFVRPEDRVATFDNDGTLWCEQPLQTQFYFGRERLEALVAQDPTLKKRQPFKAYYEHDLDTIKDLGKRGLFEVAAAVHAGMTEDAFDAHARDWLAHGKNPKLGRRFTDLIYRPQVELLAYLRANGFKTFIVSGGGIDLIRAFSEERYGVPRDQVVGSSVRTRVAEEGGRIELVKLAELGTFDDREVKVENIALHIGRRPILAFGNSDGDLAMMRYANTGPGPRLALLLHHDDADREFAYDREFRLSPLAGALDRAGELGFVVVSMSRDWAAVFPEPDA
jgi:phosphoserine phosphatase